MSWTADMPLNAFISVLKLSVCVARDPQASTAEQHPHLKLREGPNVWQLPPFICAENNVILQRTHVQKKKHEQNKMNAFIGKYTRHICTILAGLL